MSGRRHTGLCLTFCHVVSDVSQHGLTLNNTVITYSRFSTSLDIDVDGHRASWSLMFQLLYRDQYIMFAELFI